MKPTVFSVLMPVTFWWFLALPACRGDSSRKLLLKAYFDSLVTVEATLHSMSYEVAAADRQIGERSFGTDYEWREDLRTTGYFLRFRSGGPGNSFEEAHAVALGGKHAEHLVLWKNGPSKGTYNRWKKENPATRLFPTPLWAIGYHSGNPAAALRALLEASKFGGRKTLDGIECDELTVAGDNGKTVAYLTATGTPLVRRLETATGFLFSEIEYSEVQTPQGLTVPFPRRYRGKWHSGSATYIVENAKINAAQPAARFEIGVSELPDGVSFDDDVAGESGILGVPKNNDPNVPFKKIARKDGVAADAKPRVAAAKQPTLAGTRFSWVFAVAGTALLGVGGYLFFRR